MNRIFYWEFPFAYKAAVRRPRAESRRVSRFHAHLRTGSFFAIGLVLAILSVEMVLHPFYGTLKSSPLAVPATILNQDLPILTLRQCVEGCVESHFYADGARLTGNAQLPQAQTALIVGASFVQAKQVADKETMGAFLEQALRNRKQQVNVRQYGYDAQSVPTYVGLAPGLLQKWNPRWVVIVMSRIDWSNHPSAWTLRVSPDGIPTMTLTSQPQTRGLKGAGRRLGERSAVIATLYLRFLDLFASSDSPASLKPEIPIAQQSEALARDYVAALKYVFRERLRILYLADVGITGDNNLNDSLRETALLAECDRRNVPCVSSRELMTDELKRNYVPATGFGNSIMGQGHLNPAGHRMAASLIESLVTAQ
jgi:hypothetical protein